MDKPVHASESQLVQGSGAEFDLEIAKSIGQMIEQGRKAPPANQTMRVGMMVSRGKELLAAEIAQNDSAQRESTDQSPAQK